MSNILKVQLLLEHTSGAPPVTFIDGVMEEHTNLIVS